jgi:hypothetical protein
MVRELRLTAALLCGWLLSCSDSPPRSGSPDAGAVSGSDAAVETAPDSLRDASQPHDDGSTPAAPARDAGDGEDAACSGEACAPGDACTREPRDACMPAGSEPSCEFDDAGCEDDPLPCLAQPLGPSMESNVKFPRLAMNPDGRALAVWTENRADYQGEIWAADFSAERGWSGTSLLRPFEGIRDARAPEVSLDESGAGLAIWLESGGPDVNVAGAIYDGARWSDPSLVLTGTNAVSHFEPFLAGNLRGDAILTWGGWSGRGTFFLVRRYAKGSGWAEQNGLTTRQGYPTFLVDAFDTALAQDATALSILQRPPDPPDTGPSRTWVNIATPGDPDGDAALVDLPDPARGQPSAPQVAIGPDGRAFALWVQSDADGPAIFANRYDPGLGWNVEQRIHSAGGSPGIRALELAIARSSDTMAVWVQSEETGARVWAARWSHGWQPAVPLDVVSEGESHAPKVASDAHGRFLVVWSRSDGRHEDILARRYDPERQWDAPISLERLDGDASDPQVGLDDHGGALVIWRQISQSWSRLWACRISD